MTVRDPLGNEVFIPESCYNLDEEQVGITDIYDSVTDVVAKPALILRIDAEFPEFYYYRSIGWSMTVLIGARSVDGHYEVHHCITNPTEVQMGALYKRGKLVY